MGDETKVSGISLVSHSFLRHSATSHRLAGVCCARWLSSSSVASDVVSVANISALTGVDPGHLGSTFMSMGTGFSGEASLLLSYAFNGTKLNSFHLQEQHFYIYLTTVLL